MEVKGIYGVKIVKLLVVAGIVFVSCSKKSDFTSKNIEGKSSIYKNIAFPMPRVTEPTFGEYSVNIKDFGAVADGLTKNTAAIAKAIDDVAAHGGGTVVIPQGIWMTGPMVLKSNINIHAKAGALVLFSRDFDDYPLLETSFEGLNTYRCQSPIQGNNLENIAFTGEGVFDGNGDAWRMVKKSKMTESQWKKLVRSGGFLSDDERKWYPSEKSKLGDSRDNNMNVPDFKTKEEFEKIKDYLRPVFVSLVKCKNVLLDGPTFQNSPAWNVHPMMCENVILRNLTIRNPWYSQNGDGLDLESCKNALIYNCRFDVGDDAICFKSGKDQDGRDRGMPTENVIVKNCVVYHGHGGFVVGSEMSGGVKNVHVSNCLFMGTDVGLRFKSTRGRGGVVENIWISDINMIDIPTEPIRFNLYYGGKSPVLEEGKSSGIEENDREIVAVTEETPSFRNIYMKNITATGHGNAAFFMGLPEMNLKNVNLENAVLKAPKGILCIDADGINLTNVKVFVEKGTALTLYNGKNIRVEDFDFEPSLSPAIKIQGAQSSAISFTGINLNEAGKQLRVGQEVSEGAITIK